MELKKPIQTFNWHTVSINQVPSYMQDNVFVLREYRPPLANVFLVLASAFRLHNETVNIWTHAITAALFIRPFYNVVLRPPTHFDQLDRLYLGGYCACVISTFTCSVLYHLFTCYTQRSVNFFSKLDYTGISCLIAASLFPWLYYAFYEFHTHMILYMANAIIWLIAFVLVILYVNFHLPEYRWYRAAFFLFFGFSGIIPALHYVTMINEDRAIEHFNSLLIMGTFYVLGTAIYVMQIPERFKPGAFDIFGNSHQIFHILTSVGSIIHFRAVYELANHRMIAIRNK